jgi:hypothetical protein
MKINKTLRNYSIFILFILVSISLHSQVGVNTVTPGDGAMLDITSTDKGMLIPRIDITDLSTIAPITGGSTESLLVYNTNITTGKGFYYWDGSNWIGFGGADWKQGGNAGTTPGTGAGQNFAGTTDNQDFIIARNSTEAITLDNNEAVINDPGNDYDFRIESNTDANIFFVDASSDNVGIGVSTPALINKLEIYSGTRDAVYGYSDNVGGILGREQNITIGIAPSTQTMLGAGLYANNPFAGYTSIFGQSTGAATVAAAIQYSDVWIGSYTYVDNSNVGFNPSSAYVELNKNESTTGGLHTALTALSGRDAGGNPGFQIGAIVGSVAGRNSGTQTEDTYGIIAQATNTASEYAIGGQFVGMGGAGGYVVNIADDLNNRKIVGNGTVSEVIPTQNHGRVILTAPESPEYWYQDYGTVTMTNGQATINIDAILSDIIVVDTQNPVRVICTPYQMPYFNGITVMSYDKKTVILKELNGGTHSGTLHYQLVVKPKTNFGEGRFPQASGPYFAKDLKLTKAKTKNQNRMNNTPIFEWPADWEVYGYENVAREYMNGNALRKNADNANQQK